MDDKNVELRSRHHIDITEDDDRYFSFFDLVQGQAHDSQVEYVCIWLCVNFVHLNFEFLFGFRFSVFDMLMLQSKS
jgi:hypothetical protein